MLNIEYISKIISSTDNKPEIRNITSLKELKKSTENLPKIREIIKEFEQSHPLILQTHTKEHKEFISSIGNSNEIIKKIIGLRNINSEIIKNEDINEKLDILAYYLNSLKVTTLNKDYKQARRLMNKFLIQEDLSLKSMISQTKEFEDSIKQLRLNYLSLLEHTSSHHKGLEDKASITFENSALSKLHHLNNKQKSLLNHICKEFSTISRKFLKDKEYRKFLKEK